MLDVVEDERNEFKLKVTDKLENEVISFLNSKGGNIFIGVDDKGKILGINENVDCLQRKIKDRLKDNISPSIIGLYDVIALKKEDKNYIKIVVARGNERPYYLSGMGMTPDSCFIRIGSAIQKMTNSMINSEFSKRNKNSLRNIISPKQDLTFNQLKIYYEEKGFKINDNFFKQLELYTEEGKYNYIAYLLADNNSISIQFGKYSGTNSVDLIENEDFGCCCLIKSANNILNKLKIENKTFTKITFPERKEKCLFDFISIREATINALCHNDWSKEYAPKFEIFKDKIVISSNGGIQDGITKEEFLQGFSLPKNKELMKVFKDLKLVEQMGTGIIRILENYDKNSFEFFPNFIRVTFPFDKNQNKDTINNEISEIELSETQKEIISLISKEPNITQNTIARLLNVNIRTIQRNISELINLGIIKRIGTDKFGEWTINNRNK